jgi:radical SAM superfamily enzyme YgiQ (UPF0313 family)
MVINGTWNGRSITISLKPNSLTASIQTDAGAQVMSYDLEGRLWTAMLEGISYRRGLDGKVIAKWLVEGGGKAGLQGGLNELRARRWLLPEGALELEERLRSRMNALSQAIQIGEVSLDGPLSETGKVAFARAIAFDRARSQADAAAYHRVYKPVGILPPDQYMAVVLQATEGCAFNTCTYCQFYRDRPFRIKSPYEFRAHAEAVRDYLGDGLSLRRTIFFGDANALVAPMNRLLPLVEVAHQVYDVEALGGVYAFLDGFSGGKKSVQDYETLVEGGLKRAYVGLESGSARLLRFLRKPGSPDDAVQAVRTMKAGGAAVGVIVLLGAGGKAYDREHVRDTVRVINAMQLDMDDILYFSELIEAEGMPYVQDAYQAGLKPLTSAERIAQAEQIESQLRFSQAGGTPHISRYDIREFVY